MTNSYNTLIYKERNINTSKDSKLSDVIKYSLLNHRICLSELQNNTLMFQEKTNRNRNLGKFAHCFNVQTAVGPVWVHYPSLKVDYPNLKEDYDEIQFLCSTLSAIDIERYVMTTKRSKYLSGIHYERVKDYIDTCLNTFEDWNCALITLEKQNKTSLDGKSNKYVKKERSMFIQCLEKICNQINEYCIEQTGEPGILYDETLGGSQFGVFEIHDKTPDMHFHCIVTVNYKVLVKAKLIKHKNKFKTKDNTERCKFYDDVLKKILQPLYDDKRTIVAKNNMCFHMEMMYDVFNFFKGVRYLHKSRRKFKKNLKIPYFKIIQAKNLKPLEKESIDNEAALIVINKWINYKNQKVADTYEKNGEIYEKIQNQALLFERYDIIDENKQQVADSFKLYVSVDNPKKFKQDLQYVTLMRRIFNDILRSDDKDAIFNKLKRPINTFIDFLNAVSKMRKTLQGVINYMSKILKKYSNLAYMFKCYVRLI